MNREVIIQSKNRHAGKLKEPVVVSQETWELMQQNGTASNFRVVTTASDPAVEAEKQRKIDEFTERIKVIPAKDSDFDMLMKQYRQLKKADKQAAIKLLDRLIQMQPDNKYLMREVELNKQTS